MVITIEQNLHSHLIKDVIRYCHEISNESSKIMYCKTDNHNINVLYPHLVH